ncbi:MAG: calcium-binding protein, partial [Oscillospiraceae bacterium]|nr:calcium-binding protein [Oscillospiraceae bacterium]
MENSNTIIEFVTQWRSNNNIADSEVLTEEQAKTFLADFKAQLNISASESLSYIIINSDDLYAQAKETAEKIIEDNPDANVKLLSDVPEIQIINSVEFKETLLAAVGDQWYERIYSGSMSDGENKGYAFDGSISVKDYTYREALKSNMADEAVAVVSEDTSDSIFNRTLLSEILADESVKKINSVPKDDILSMAAYSVRYLSYTADEAAEFVQQYVEFLSTAYTENTLVSLKENESYSDYFARVKENQSYDRYTKIIDFQRDVNDLKSDIIYFLGEYGQYIDNESVEELSQIAGIRSVDIDIYTSAIIKVFGDRYSYTSDYIKRCVESVKSQITAGDDKKEDSESDRISDAVSDTNPDNNDNNDQPTQPDNSNEKNTETGYPSQSEVSHEDTSDVTAGTPESTHDATSSTVTPEQPVNTSNSKKASITAVSTLPASVTGTGSGGAHNPVNTSQTSPGTSDTSSQNPDTDTDDRYYDDEQDVNNIASQIITFFGGASAAGSLSAALNGPLCELSRGAGLGFVIANAISSGEDPADAAGRYVFGTVASQFATNIAMGVGLGTAANGIFLGGVSNAAIGGITGTTAGAAIAAACADLPVGLIALGVCEVAFIGNVAGETIFDCVDAWMNGESANPFKVFADNWVEDSEAIFFPIFDAIGLDKLINWFDSSKTARVVVDPLIVDIDGDGFTIIDKANGVYFDKDNNGYKERIDWTSADAFLVLDLNENGVIDNGSELFGDTTYLADGTYAKNGFEALAQYDENGDTIINSADSVFDRLLLWTDANADGVSQSSELKKVTDLGITSFSTVANEEKISTGTEAVIDGTSEFTFSDGSNGHFGALWATSNLYDTKETGESDISLSFNIGHIGNIPSLSVALANDDGTLKGFIDSFNQAVTSKEKMECLDNILYAMTNSLDIAANARGTNIDARKLNVIETMMGESFVGVNGANPNSTAANLLKNIYNNISDAYYTAFISQSVKPYLNYLVPYETQSGGKSYYTGYLCFAVDYEMKKNPDSTILNDICKYLVYYGINNEINYDVLTSLSGYFSYDNKYKSSLDKQMNSHGIYIGTNSDDIIRGTGNSDTLIGGKGNDTLYGGYANDTYIFNKGDGADTINEEGVNSGFDKVVFGEGISKEDITVTRDSNDMVLLIGNEGDSLRITRTYTNSSYQVEQFEFADESVVKLDEYLSTSLHITESENGVIGDYDGGYGTRNSTLIGTDKAETIYGYSGDDTLIGGKGNDTLYGGYANDTYIFNKGDGADTIN